MTHTQIAPEQHGDAALTWRRSSSCPNGASCVEVAALPTGGFALRDGKNPAEPHLEFGAPGWTEFLSGVRAGDFDPARRRPSRTQAY